MYRLSFFILTILLLSGCAIQQAENAYKSGNYQETVSIIADYLDKKGALPNESDSESMFSMMNNIVISYENKIATASDGDYGTKISAYDHLLSMRKRLNNRFYDDQIRFLTGKYSVEQLNKNIAEQYYLKGKSIKPSGKDSYLAIANAFSSGAEYYDYQDIKQLRDSHYKKYATLNAGDFYQLGLAAIKTQDYASAAKAFFSAEEAYRQYGSYKDSSSLAVKYDKQDRKQASDQHYKDAVALSRTAISKYDYRRVAEKYSEAYKAYAKYGQVNDAQLQMNKYSSKGQVRVYIVADSGLQTKVEKELNYTFIDFTSSAASADVVINLSMDSDYKKEHEKRRTEALSENIVVSHEMVKNDKGELEKKNVYKEYKFNRKELENRNRLNLTARLNVSGAFSYQNSYEEKASSYYTEFSYSGDVPKKYRDYSEGRWKSEDQLYDEAYSDVWRKIKKDIAIVYDRMTDI